MRQAYMVVGIALAALGSAPDSARAGEAGCSQPRYYVLLFGGQGNVLRPRTAHTWATYVRATDGPDGVTHIEQFTISWLPAALDIRPWALHPEKGINLDLYQTLEFMSGSLRRISLWGPYEVTADHYHHAARHRTALEAGAHTYRVFDFLGWNHRALHCVHAVTKADPAVDRSTPPIVWFGELVTAPVAAAMARSGAAIEPRHNHDWLLPALGLSEDDFVRRRYGYCFPFLRK